MTTRIVLVICALALIFAFAGMVLRGTGKVAEGFESNHSDLTQIMNSQ